MLVSELARVHPSSLRDLRASLGDYGVCDLLTVIGQGPQSDGVISTAPRHLARSLTMIERRTLSGLASELSAIVRLRHLRRPAAREARLSDRGRHVAVLLSRGCSDKEIARELGVAMSTVSTFANRIRQKVGGRGGAALASVALADSDLAIRRRRAIFERLTPAERAVAAEVIAGCSYEEISPVNGDLRGLPALLVVVGELELGRDDASALVRRALEAGVEARLHVEPDMVHAFMTFGRNDRATRHTLDVIERFLEQRSTLGAPVTSKG